MKIPSVRGIIDRRILVNYRVEPEILRRMLPAPFEPKVYAGYGIAGVCLIRLQSIRPPFVPGWLGTQSENAAHRIAVQWWENGSQREGVYIPRRDTSSWINTLAGGRLFPGMHHRAHFEVVETDTTYRVALQSTDDETRVLVAGTLTRGLPDSSIFPSLHAVSDFFEAGALGYSATAQPGHYDGLELRSFIWEVQPLAITEAYSSFFSDPSRFPPGTIAFDNALLMRGIPHEWQRRATLCAA